MRLSALVPAIGLLIGAGNAQAERADLQVTSPEDVGFSSERLKRLDAVMQRAVDEKEYAGVVTLLARHGKVIHFRSFGKQDLASGVSLERDSIFRIFSMTKPVTAAAMMLLYEEGKWTPRDPIYKFIPQFAGLKVYTGTTDFLGKMQLEDPVRAPNLRDLMTHTAGFGYGYEQNPVDRLYRDPQDGDIFATGSLQAMIDRLAKAPLLYQPGTRWKYSLSMDIQGHIIEKLSGMTLPEFMKKRLFEPLGMKDTDFYVPKKKRSRFANLYEIRDDGSTLEPVAPFPPMMNYEKQPTLPSGGGGLVSTAADYFRFAQMLLNGGELDGVRILAPQTVKLMISNHLADNMTAESKEAGFIVQPRPGLGYGFNAGVVTDPGLADVPMGKGTYLWDGAAGTWFWIDPTNDIVFVGMVQRLCWFARPCRSAAQESMMGMPPNLEEMSRATTYQALLDPDR